MPRVVFELTTPALERAKTIHALDRAAVGDILLREIWLAPDYTELQPRRLQPSDSPL
jgi:hypothetical protein